MASAQEIQAIQTTNQLLAQNLLDAAKRAIEYLSLTNGGAVIACLAFIGSSSPNAHSKVALMLLAVFLIALILTGVALARGAMTAYLITTEYQRNSFDFLMGGSTTYAQVTQRLLEKAAPKKAHKSARLNVALLLASFCLFAAGAIVACGWLISST